MLSGPEESNLVRAAAAGDGPAFARLYEAYERRIFNYLLRLLGDQHEAEDATQEAFIKVMAKLPDLDQENLQFGAYLYTAARNAGYDVISSRKRMEPGGAVPEQAESPLRGELADLESDPERAALAGSQEVAVQAASRRLPERQREVLALRELDGLSYDEIAGVMEMKSNAVAQLISRARIALRKEMRAGAAASVAFVSADCERAHGELACRQDGQETGFDSQWLDVHLALCSNCQVAAEEMAEAGVSYRAWAPVVPAAWLFREVMARASETNGHDWSEVERPSSGGGSAPSAGVETATQALGRGRRALLAACGSMLVAGVFAALLIADANAPEKVPVARESALRPVAGPIEKHRKHEVKAPRRKPASSQEPIAATVVTDVDDPAEAPVPASPDRPSSPTRPAPDSDAELGGGNQGDPDATGDSKPVSKPEEPTTPTPEPEPEPEPERPVVTPCVPAVGAQAC
jgi:RNA polymerase sigma-70 factor (ECF subfamily)